jgi:cytochrome bd-type quinol oxidase subunit 2
MRSLCAAFLTLAMMFWPYMIPYQITVGNAAAPEASLSFLFWGAGVFAAIAIYTAAVYWLFRGKVTAPQRWDVGITETACEIFVQKRWPGKGEAEY